MLAILNFLNAHNCPIFQQILMIPLSKCMVHIALFDKTCMLLGLLSPLKPHFWLEIYNIFKFWCHNSREPSAQYVNWNKHPVPVPPSSRLIHYELQHSCVTSCRKSWCESCWYSSNCEGPPIKIHFSIDLSTVNVLKLRTRKNNYFFRCS